MINPLTLLVMLAHETFFMPLKPSTGYRSLYHPIIEIKKRGKSKTRLLKYGFMMHILQYNVLEKLQLT